METDQESDEFVPRNYQVQLMEIALKENTIIFLPTGSGKTFIAVLVLKRMSSAINKPISEGGKLSIMLVNTVALVDQQSKSLRRHTIFKVGAYSGDMNVDFWDKKKWEDECNKHQILVMTAQILVNIVQSSFLTLNDINLIIFDECHRGVCDHAMRQLMGFFENFDQPPRVLGLTATLLNKNCKPTRVMEEVRTLETTYRSKVATVDDLQLVVGYSTNPTEKLKFFDLMPSTEVEIIVITILENMVDLLNNIRIIDQPAAPPPNPFLKPNEPVNKVKDLVNLVKDVICHIKMLGIFGGTQAIIAHMIQVERIKKHCQDQRLFVVTSYIATIFASVKVKFEHVMKDFNEKDKIYGFSTPKVLVLFEILKEYKNKSSEPLCGLIFVQRRFTAKILYHMLLSLKDLDPDLSDISPNFIVGFAMSANNSREALFNNKMQRKVVQMFTNKELNLLVASNVVEEGIDVPRCTLVVKFDKPVDYRSYIQSKGRARHRSSYYYLMCDRNDHQFLDRYNIFQEVERILNNFLIGQNEIREAPSEEEIEQVYNEQNYQTYYTNGAGSAQINLVSAISLVCRYCSSLPADKYTVYIPNWFIEEKLINYKKHYKVVVQLPIVCPISETIEGEYLPTKKLAKRSAFLQTSILLHKKGELDNNLLPRKHDVTGEDVSFLFKHWPENNEKEAGTGKKRRPHKQQIPLILKRQLLSHTCAYLHVIELIPKFSMSLETSNYATFFTKSLYTSGLCYGCVTSNAVPEICEFPVFVTPGQIDVKLMTNVKTLLLTHEQIRDIREFHYIIFNDLLKVLERKEFLVFNNDDSMETLLVVPVRKIDTFEVDFNIIAEHKQLKNPTLEMTTEQKRNLVVNNDTYLEKIVTPWYRPNPTQYVVAQVCTDLTPLSKFPSADFSTFKNYFKEKYQCRILNLEQPLLLVKGLSQRLNCLKPRGAGGKRNKAAAHEELEEHLVPELCVKQEFPGALWLQAIILPTILHRIIQLLTVEELRQNIAVETEIGIQKLGKGEHWIPLKLDSHLLNYEIAKPHKIDSPKNEADLNSSPISEIAEKLNKDFAKKMLEVEYPWQDEDEPIDIERHLDVSVMEIHDYDNFVTQKISLEERDKKNEMQHKQRDVPALTYPKNYEHKDIEMLKLKINSRGPELAEIYKALCTAKSNEVVNLERFETLGDSFLKLSVSLYIVLKYPKYDEGKATALKGKLISNKNLYYLGVQKNIGGYLKNSDLTPSFDWRPPSFALPKILQEKITKHELPVSSLFQFTVPFDEQIKGELEEETIKQISEIDFEKSDDDSEDSCYSSMSNFLGQQVVSDKTVADCVEAILGAYFQSNGFSAGIRLLEWFNIIPKSENLGMLLMSSPPNPILNTNASEENINFHLPTWQSLEESLGYHFNNRAYLLQALTHSSYTPNRITNCYQILEFLGDAVLDFLITCHIFESCGYLSPGELTDLRSALVNNITFAGFSVRCGFHKHLLFINSQLQDYIDNFVQFQEVKNFVIDDEVLYLMEEGDLYLSKHVDVPKVLGDVFEALAGAVFLDSGLDLTVVWKVFYKIMWKEIDIFSQNVPKNAVRLIYERQGAHPSFCKSINLDNGGTMIGLDFMLNGAKKRVFGYGENKNLAKKAAAKIALRLLNN